MRDVGGLAFSKPTDGVPVANTDSGSNPCIWLLISQTLLQETETIAL